MGRYSKSNPSFFKILIKGSAVRLRMPPAFLVHFPEKDLPESSTITTEGQEKYWKVGMDVTGDGYFFSHGWPELVKDLDLSLGDFLVFTLLAPSTFQIVPYDKTCCEKPLNLPVKLELRLVEASASQLNGPCCVVEINRHKRYQLFLPLKFAAGSGLLEKESVVLVNSQGSGWPVQISARKNKQTGRVCRVYLTKGWREFRVANQLADGVYCTLAFIHNKIHLSTIVTMEESSRALSMQ